MHYVRQLLLPPRPVVITVVAPIVEPGRDAFLAKYCVKFACRSESDIFPTTLSDDNDNLVSAIKLHPRVVGRHVAQEIYWGVCVSEFVGIERETVGSAVESGEGNNSIKDVWTTEEEVCSVHSTHRATGYHEGLLVPIADVWHEFLDNVVEPTLVLLNTPAIVCTLV